MRQVIWRLIACGLRHQNQKSLGILKRIICKGYVHYINISDLYSWNVIHLELKWLNLYLCFNTTLLYIIEVIESIFIFYFKYWINPPLNMELILFLEFLLRIWNLIFYGLILNHQNYYPFNCWLPPLTWLPENFKILKTTLKFGLFTKLYLCSC